MSRTTATAPNPVSTRNWSFGPFCTTASEANNYFLQFGAFVRLRSGMRVYSDAFIGYKDRLETRRWGGERIIYYFRIVLFAKCLCSSAVPDCEQLAPITYLINVNKTPRLPGCSRSPDPLSGFFLISCYRMLAQFTVTEWDGETLEVSRISRLDMGSYLCIASNGVPPSVSKRIKVSVDCKYPRRFIPDSLYFHSILVHRAII